MTSKQRAWEILESARLGDRPSAAFDVVMQSLIVLNSVAVVVETVPSIERRWGETLLWFEGVSVAMFTVETLVYAWAATSDPMEPWPSSGSCSSWRHRWRWST